MIYLDNAATTYPKPECVIKAVTQALTDFGGNPGRGGHKISEKAGELVYGVREALSEMFGCESEKVIFTLNCTEALNTAIKGSVKKGDHVIITSLEHNSVLRPVHYLSEKGYITYSVAKVSPLSDGDTLKAVAALIRKETTLIVATAVSNVFGCPLPVEKLAALARTRGIRLIVDGAQAAGTTAFNLKSTGIDILCAPGHKGLYGPMGTGIMLLGEGVEVESLIQGGTGSFSLKKQQPEVYPDKLESGTLNLPGIAGLGKGIEFIACQGGEKAIYQKQSYLCRILREDLSAVKGVRLYGAMNTKKASSVVSFNLAAAHSEKVCQLLNEKDIALRGGYHCSYLAHKTYGTETQGVVRASVGYFNTKKDVKNLIFYLNKIAMGKIL